MTEEEVIEILKEEFPGIDIVEFDTSMGVKYYDDSGGLSARGQYAAP